MQERIRCHRFIQRFLLLFLSVVWLVLWPRAFTFCEEPAVTGKNLENELSQLTEISTRLGKLNEMLRNELENSRKNSSELEMRLTESKTELELLRTELEALQTRSIELRQHVAISLEESTQLKDSLQKTESSLKSLEQSFSEYKQAAEQELNRLEQSRNRYRLLTIIAGTLALSGWAAFSLSLVF